MFDDRMNPRRYGRKALTAAVLAAACATAGPGPGTDGPDEGAPGRGTPTVEREDADDSWLWYPAGDRPAGLDAVSKDCREYLERLPFKGRYSTHVIVAQFKAATPELQAEARELEAMLAEQAEQAFRIALDGAPIEREAPGLKIEVFRLPCVVESHVEAQALAAAARGHVVVWGWLSHATPRPVRGSVRIFGDDLNAEPAAVISAGNVRPGAPYHVVSSVSLYHDTFGGGGDLAPMILQGLGADAVAGDRADRLGTRIRLAVALNLIQRGTYWLASRMLKDPALHALLAEYTRERDELRHAFLAQLHIAMSDIPAATAALDQAFAASKRHVRTVFGAQLWVLRGALHTIKGEDRLALDAHREAAKILRYVLSAETMAPLIGPTTGAGPTGSSLIEWSVAPLEVLVAMDLMHMGQLVEAEAQLRKVLRTLRAGGGSHPFLPMALSLESTLHRARGDTKLALAAARRARDELDALFAVATPGSNAREQMTIDISLNLTMALADRGEFTQADRVAQDLLSRSRRVFGATHPLTLSAQSLVASLADRQGDHERAIAAWKSVLAGYQALHAGKETSDTVVSRNNLGVALQRARRWDEALQAFRDAIAAGEQVYAPDDERQWSALNNAAGLLTELGRTAEAPALYEGALRRIERAKLTATPAYATVLSNLGITEFELDRPRKALARFQRARGIVKKTLPRTGDLSALANLHNSIANVKRSLGDVQGALRDGQEALRLEAEASGTSSERYLGVLNTLASIYGDLGRVDEAERLLLEAQRALQADRNDGPSEHEARLANNLGMVYKQRGDFPRALAAFHQARQLARAAGVPAQNDLSLVIDANIAVELYNLKRHAEARAEGEATLVRLRQKFGDRHHQVVGLRWILGEIALVEGRPRDAIGLLEPAVQRLRSVGEVDAMRFSVLSALARAYQATGNTEKELAMRTEMVAVAERQPPAKRADEVTWSRFNLAELLRRIGRVDEAHQQSERIIAEGGTVTTSSWIVIDAFERTAKQHHAAGRHEEELAALHRGLELARRHGRSEGIGALHDQMARCYHERDMPAARGQALARGIELVRASKSPDTYWLAALLSALGDHLNAIGEPEAAISRYREAVDVSRGTTRGAELRSSVHTLIALSQALDDRGRLTEARDAANEALGLLDTAAKLGHRIDPREAALVDQRLAEVQMGLQDYRGSLQIARRALTRTLAIEPVGWGVATNLLRLIAIDLAALGEDREADQAWKAAIDAGERTSWTPAGRARLMVQYAFFLRTRKRLDEAAQMLDRGHRTAPELLEVSEEMAELALARGELARAAELAGAVIAAKAPEASHCRAHLIAGIVGTKQEQWATAAESFELALRPACDRRTQALARWHGILARSRLGAHVQAAALYDGLGGELMATLPLRAKLEIHVAGARAHQLSRRPEAAAKACQEALAAVGPEAALELRIGTRQRCAALLTVVGRATEAAKQMELAGAEVASLRGQPGHATHLAYAAVVYTLLGQDERARATALAARSASANAPGGARAIQEQLVVVDAIRAGWRPWTSGGVVVLSCASETCRELEPGDVVVRYDGRPLMTTSDLQRGIADAREKRRIVVEVARGGRARAIEVRPGLLGIRVFDG